LFKQIALKALFITFSHRRISSKTSRTQWFGNFQFRRAIASSAEHRKVTKCCLILKYIKFPYLISII